MSTDVSQQRQEYKDMLPYVEMNRAAVGGHRTVRAGGVKYLTPLASMMCNESGEYIGSMDACGQAKYNKYLSNSYFIGVTGVTVKGLRGLISSKKPIKNIPKSIEYISDNVNGRGQTLRDFADEANGEAFETPWSGVLVARPSTPEGTNKLKAEQENLRPKLLHYKFESIINWDWDVINNEDKLSLVVLKEQISKRTDFNVEMKDQYRVLEMVGGIYTQSLYDEEKKLVVDSEGIEQYQIPVIFNGKHETEIPFYWIVADTMKKSVIDDLVDCNFEHYNVYADYGSKLHYSSFIIYTENGINEGEETRNKAIGNGVKWEGGADAEFGILQPDGNADSHRIALQDTELRMSSLLASILKGRTSGAESAEAKSLDQVTQNTVTASVAITVGDAIQRALNFASKIEGGTEDAVFEQNTDYDPALLNSQLLSVLSNMQQIGQISQETLYENMQKGDIANPDRTFEEEQALVVNTGIE